MSETAQCRGRLAPFCTGMGLDVGFGGDPIAPHAITMDLPTPYTSVGKSPQHLSGDCRELYWFRNGVLDFIFSSHLIEDFEYLEQARIIKEWLRVLKVGGRIVLYQPDELVYSTHCRATGQPYNLAHKESDFSLATFKDKVLKWGGFNVAIDYENPQVETYSWEIVIRKQ